MTRIFPRAARPLAVVLACVVALASASAAQRPDSAAHRDVGVLEQPAWATNGGVVYKGQGTVPVL